jgi:DNA modification methylase
MRLVEHIERRALTTLSPYAHNARIHSAEQVAQIAQSIKTFGFNNPILIDGEGGIIAGHGRYAAALKLGMEAAPVIVLDHLSDRERRAYIIADNKLAENATWDDAVLAAELAALNEEEFDLSILGFDDRELESYLRSDEPDERADECPPVPEAATTVLGDLWVLGRHRVLCGDATDAEAVKCVMAGAKAQLVVTDPPYNVAYIGKTAEALTIENDRLDDSDFYSFLLQVYGNLSAAMDSGAGIYVFHADMQAVTFRKAFVDAGLKLSQCCVWVKHAMVMGRNDYHWQHEPVVYGWKPAAAHRWYSDRSQTTVWAFDRPMRSVEHPTMKPVQLLEYLIQNSSKRDDNALDAFLGSGSTLIACEKTKRVCFGMELSPEYCDVIVTRWQEYTGKTATLDGDGRTFAEVRAERVGE